MREETISKIPKVNRRSLLLCQTVAKSLLSVSARLVISTYQFWEINLLVCFEEEFKVFIWLIGTGMKASLFGGVLCRLK